MAGPQASSEEGDEVRDIMNDSFRNLVQGTDLESYTDCNGKSMECVKQISYGDFYFLKSTLLITRVIWYLPKDV